MLKFKRIYHCARVAIFMLYEGSKLFMDILKFVWGKESQIQASGTSIKHAKHRDANETRF